MHDVTSYQRSTANAYSRVTGARATSGPPSSLNVRHESARGRPSEFLSCTHTDT